MESSPKTVTKELLDAMGVAGASVSESQVGGQTVYSIEGVADTRQLIGMHGDTIHAIDHLVKKILENMSQKDKRAEEALEGEGHRGEQMFLVDVDNYRAKQIRDIETKARMMAERARSFQYDVELSPMSAYERLIVHTALASEPNVKTESQGEGRDRRVVIKYSPT